MRQLHTNRRGFTLIEILIVVAIVAIIAAVALPSYTDHVTRTRRAAAAGCMTEIANAMERTFTTSMSYLPSGTTTMPTLACTDETKAYYSYSLDPAVTNTTTYSIKADPVGSQLANDTKCATLSLNNQGVKAVSGSLPKESCWR